MSIECPNCHSENLDDSKFCRECATPLPLSEEIARSLTKTLHTPAKDLIKGKTLAGRYQLIEELARGGMGVVYKAEDIKLKRTVALKFLPPELTHISDIKERFIREAQTAAALDHPHICTVYEFDEAEGKTFIAMAYIEGKTLRKKIESGPLEIDEALRIAIQIAEGLQDAHKKGIVHRDIKSANIMIDERDQAKIMDFGLARKTGGTLITKNGTTMGTIAYMSPEQAQGEKVDHRTDIWSFGVVLYEIFTGQLPFKGEHDLGVVHSILNAKPRPITDIHSDIPISLGQVVAKAMEKNPDERYQKINELLEDLRSIFEGGLPDKIKSRLPTGTVSFLSTDLVVSPRVIEEHQESKRETMARYDKLVRSAFNKRGGSVFKTEGHSFWAAFVNPRPALEAALAVQLAISEEEWGDVEPFLVRMALHTGNAEERDGNYYGPTLHKSASLLATALGGQILVSLATSLLLSEDLPPDTQLIDLGAHRLQDLDQDEHLFQVVHPELQQDFSPILSEDLRRDGADQVIGARQAHSCQEWQTAYERFACAEVVRELDPEDIQRYAEAAWWIGRNNESISLRERAYAAFLTQGKNEAAACQAIQLAEAFYHRLSTVVSGGWVARAEKLLAGQDEGPAHGYLNRFKAVVAFERDGDPERGVELAEAVLTLGEKFGDRNLEVLGIQDKGRMLVSMGRIEEGMHLMDEAMAAAVGGELNPETTGRSYCNMLAVCDNIADYRRAGEWVEAAEKWCKSHSESAIPGVCRIFSAEVKWLQGSWESAAAEVRRAVEELSGFTDIIGAAWYQLGEIELRVGNLEKAEEFFRLAHENGRTPFPGMARLHLIRGDPSAALELLGDALAPGRLGPLSRARLLPTSIEAQLAIEEYDRALEAIMELEATAALSKSVALEAAADQARGALSLSTDRASEAVDELQTSVYKWCHLKMPYEAARARILLSQAHKRAGNKTAASLELESARSVLRRLGATWDLQRLDKVAQN